MIGWLNKIDDKEEGLRGLIQGIIPAFSGG
jgi:hypothetical protein